MSDTEKIDVQAIVESFTGFDEIAIEQFFRAPIEELKGTLIVRAVLFVKNRRDGMKDRDSFQDAMNRPASELNTMFVAAEDDEAEGKDDAPENVLA